MIALGDQLRSIDRSISRLTAERLKVLAEIAKLDAEDGASERQTASRVARLTSTTPKQAAGEVAMAKQVSALPGIADAHAKGEISNGQLGAVAAIAAASSETEALALAKTATSSQLHQRAAASRGNLFEERCKAQKGRYLAFKPEEDGQSTRIHGRLPFAESKQLETQLRKIADRIGLCDKERPSPSARMADALLILTKHNPSQSLHDHEKQAQKPAQHRGEQPPAKSSDESRRSQSSTDGPAPSSSKRQTTDSRNTPSSSTTQHPAQLPAPAQSVCQSSLRLSTQTSTAPATQSTRVSPQAQARFKQALETTPTSTTQPLSASVSSQPPPTGTGQTIAAARPELYALTSFSGSAADSVVDYDEEPFPEITYDTDPYFQVGCDNETDIGEDHLVESREDSVIGAQFARHAGNSRNAENAENEGNEGNSATAMINQVSVQRADTRVIIHWNAQSGELNYENGPPIDHPRLMALLCDAQIDIQHCNADGLPTGLISTAHHSTWRQDRYLAFRDGPCRVPECEGIGKTQAHHIFKDRIDRVTSVESMINVCNHCHGGHHDGQFTIAGNPEQTITFTYKDGTTLFSTARPLPNTLKRPKPVPLSKHQAEFSQAELLGKSA